MGNGQWENMQNSKSKNYMIMKNVIAVLIMIGLPICVYSQKMNTEYDSTLAKKYAADDYGMKWYTLVMLKTGPVKISDKKIVDSLFAGHLKNIGRLADEGKLVVAGPLGKNDKYRGIFILTATTIEDANVLLETDPAIREKLLEPEIFRWYGSAALPEYLGSSKKVGKYSF
jgi:uncharacterized protein YciI